ncbi:hypothetical protein WN943_012280 [Citrus x changshan-huyou]
MVTIVLMLNSYSVALPLAQQPAFFIASRTGRNFSFVLPKTELVSRDLQASAPAISSSLLVAAAQSHRRRCNLVVATARRSSPAHCCSSVVTGSLLLVRYGITNLICRYCSSPSVRRRYHLLLPSSATAAATITCRVKIEVVSASPVMHMWSSPSSYRDSCS